MNSYLARMHTIAPAVLRIGVSLVFLWFGSQQLLDVNSWTRLIPEFVTSITGLSATFLVYFNGAFEIIFATCLILGYFTRISAFMLAVHMIHIMVAVGYGPTGVRDFGIAIATVATFLNGPTIWSVDTRESQDATLAR